MGDCGGGFDGVWFRRSAAALRTLVVGAVATLGALGALGAVGGCQDISVAVGTGDGGGGGGGDASVPPGDTVGPRPDTVGPGPDAVGPGPDTVGPGPDTVGPGPDTVGPGPDTVGPPDDVPIVADTGADVPVPPDTVGPDVVNPLACVERVLDPPFGMGLATAFTAEGTDQFGGSCGGEGSKEFAYGWEVPFADWFILDTEGSDFDTALYLLEGGCEGTEAACNNDISPTNDTSRIVRRFAGGDTFVVVVDGNSGSRGNAVLNINPVDCPDADVGDGRTLPQTYSTATGPSVHGGACGGDAGPERSFRFTPSATGLWRISARADLLGELDTALYVERGPICGTPLLQCNGHDNARIGMPTQVTRFLRAGDPVTVTVDSRRGAGRFDLAAEKLGDTCPAIPAAGFLDQEFDIHDSTDVMTSSCGQNADVEFGTFTPYPDLLFLADDTEPGSGTSCTVAIAAGFPFSLSVVGGECSGEELACRASAAGGDLGNELYYPLPGRGGKLTLVISPTAPEWSGWMSSEVRINFLCVA